MVVIASKIRWLMLASSISAFVACGGGGGGGSTSPSATPSPTAVARTGQMVYASVDTLYAVNMATGQTRVLLTPLSDLNYDPPSASVSSTGEVAMAFNRNFQAWKSKLTFLNADGSVASTKFYDYEILSAPRFSADGSKLAYATRTYVGGATQFTFALRVVSKDGSFLYLLENASRPEWLPDDGLVYYDLDDNKLYRIGPGDNDVPVAVQDATSTVGHSVSPDGTKLVTVRRAAQGAPRHIFMSNVDGTGLRQVTTSTNSEETQARFSPDGKELLVTTYGCIAATGSVGSGSIDEDLIHVIPADSQMLALEGNIVFASTRLNNEQGGSRCTRGTLSWR